MAARFSFEVAIVVSRQREIHAVCSAGSGYLNGKCCRPRGGRHVRASQIVENAARIAEGRGKVRHLDRDYRTSGIDREGYVGHYNSVGGSRGSRELQTRATDKIHSGNGKRRQVD